MSNLGDYANITAILTAVVAVVAYGAFISYRWRKINRLKKYLKSEKVMGNDHGQRTLLHLISKVGMTEAELLEASFRSKHIERKVTKNDQTDKAESILLEWKD